MQGTNTALQRYLRADLRQVRAVYAKASRLYGEESKDGKVVEGEFGG